MSGSKFVYVTYIRITPETLWRALTTPEIIKQYRFGMSAESEWRVRRGARAPESGEGRSATQAGVGQGTATERA